MSQYVCVWECRYVSLAECPPDSGRRIALPHFTYTGCGRSSRRAYWSWKLSSLTSSIKQIRAYTLDKTSMRMPQMCVPACTCITASIFLCVCVCVCDSVFNCLPACGCLPVCLCLPSVIALQHWTLFQQRYLEKAYWVWWSSFNWSVSWMYFNRVNRSSLKKSSWIALCKDKER